MVCRKFQFQVFSHLDENGKGTLKEEEAVQCTRSTAFLVADHLSQLLINDGMSREGTLVALLPLSLCLAMLWSLQPSHSLLLWCRAFRQAVLVLLNTDLFLSMISLSIVALYSF